ncbi:MAG: NAD(P)/FAD-dependent oxidoreductase [Chloroflexota bacterium]|nr:NAD(P)/FAD-dependent oxidoreductase [Chloroflexota bacterium]
MYDAIVVGARCAGSPTAMLLARKGYNVLLVDRATFPSDTMRNHFIRHRGVAQLEKWGLLDRVIASGCPPVRQEISDLGDFPLAVNAADTSPVEGVDAEYAPRRYVLDKILVDAAAEAGVEVREGFSVSDVLLEDGRVTGVRGKSKGGAPVEEKARIVIGADGLHSIVARAVGAPTYNEKPVLTCGYYSYWSGLPVSGLEVWYRSDPAFVIIVFPTNSGLTCAAVQVPVSRFSEFRLDVERHFMDVIDLAPDFSRRLRAGRREERFYGTGDLPNFFRKPYGPGWALVGDAGYHKDPISARGVSDAFRDAELLTDAIDEGFSGRLALNDALAEYERQRNEAATPEYTETCYSASFRSIPTHVYERRSAKRASIVDIKS